MLTVATKPRDIIIFGTIKVIMENVILIIHLILALSLIGLILLQRSEGGGLGIGGGGGGMGGFASAGQTANALSRTTAICATAFFVTSLTLAILAGTHHKSGSVLDSLDAPVPAVVDAKDADKDGIKGTSTPTNDHSVDTKDATGDKDFPKASDKPKPQSGAPSAPISE